jgi:hypothetical protein
METMPRRQFDLLDSTEKDLPDGFKFYEWPSKGRNEEAKVGNEKGKGKADNG